MAERDDMKGLRLLALIEANTITGPAKNLLEFAKHAPAQGIELIVATFVRHEEPLDTLFKATARSHGIQVETVYEKAAWDRAVCPQLRSLANDIHPDVIQTHAVKSHFLSRLSGLPGLAPWVAFHHGYTSSNTRTHLYNQLDRWSLRAATRVLTVCVPFRDQLIKRGVAATRIDIIHNAIMPTWGRAARHYETSRNLKEKLGIPAFRKIVLIVGRLSREKDHLTLLDAFRRIPKQLEPHLIIVGEGPERSRITKKITDSALGDCVTITGQQDSAEAYYGIADVAVLSSLSEGSPNALLEAMASGVPTVATRVGGIPEIVEHGESAFLVNTRDPVSLSDAITRLLADQSLSDRMSQCAAERVEKYHAPQVRTRRLAEIYREVVKR